MRLHKVASSWFINIINCCKVCFMKLHGMQIFPTSFYAGPLGEIVSSAICVVNERVIVPCDAVPLGKHQAEGDRRLKNVCTRFTVIFAYRSKERGTHPKKRRITSLTGSISRSYWSRFPQLHTKTDSKT
jgi:hypothetical protein